MIFTPTRVYNDVVKDIKRVNLLRGGTRSTKSFSLTQIAVRWLMYGKVGNKSIPEGDFFILRESFPALRRTVLKDFHMILSREGFLPFVNHIKTTHEFTRQGRTVSFFSSDDDSKIHGPQNTIFWINEATAVKESVFNNLIWRSKAFCFLDYNPLDPDSWIRHKLEEDRMKRKGDVSLDVSTVYDNPHLSKEQMDEILDIQDPELRNVYLKGNWTKLTGLVFPHYTLIDHLPEDYKKRYYGLDFGWKDETALVECRQKGNDIYIKEIVYESELQYNVLADRINTELPGVRGVADSSSPRSINDLQNKGVRLSPSKKGPDSIIQGIQHVRTHNLFITRDSENLLKELHTYKFMKDKDGNETNKPIDYMNHLADAMRYAITHFSRKGLIKVW